MTCVSTSTAISVPARGPLPTTRVGRGVEDSIAEGEEHPIGTLRYMAPERLLGRRDARSDVYSTGVTLYELVTQTPALAAEVTAAPEGERTYQRAPNWFSAWPEVWPGLWSPTK